jgi:phosphoribosylformimino-5-aminoimidazole carboxamide ribotide isomerase
MKFRPCIDLHGNKVKQIVGSSLHNGLITNFLTDLSPAHFARMYRDDGLYGGHVIMLGPGNKTAALQAIRAFPGGLHVGGGITPDNACSYLDAGASHVIVTSYIFKDGIIDRRNLETMVKSVGKDRLVVDLSCTFTRGAYYIAADQWQKLTSTALSSSTLDELAGSCDEFLVHAVDVEGKRQGIDEALVALLADASPLPVTYAGGVRSLADLDDIYVKGKERVDVTVGSALDIFGGRLSYREVVEWHNKHAP